VRVLAAACVVAAALVLTPVPTGVRVAVVLPVALLVPGFCLARRFAPREPAIAAAVVFPLGLALLFAVAQAQIYLHAWAPKAGLVVLLLASASSLVAEIARPRRSGAP
jgi:hypothetical protein